MNELKREIAQLTAESTNLHKRLKELENKLEELSNYPLKITEPCFALDGNDDLKAFVYINNENCDENFICLLSQDTYCEDGDFLKDDNEVGYSDNDIVKVIRPMTDEEILKICKGDTDFIEFMKSGGI